MRFLKAIGPAVALAIACGAPASGASRDVRDVPLVDQSGATFTLRGLGRPTAVIFIATRCGDACPIAEALFARLSAKLQRAHLDAKLLTVTLEPDYDRPVVMARKARAFGADPARWRWASGNAADVRSVLDAFNVARLDGKFHGTFAYVLDARALPTRLVLLSADTGDELLNDLRAAGARRPV
ncbi:MAG TPA: SCO family protein [Candidatus Elarobacter sp.]|nr:SCO family protein [Candidatus Elarobacter sp.]